MRQSGQSSKIFANLFDDEDDTATDLIAATAEESD
jgi:hypothetical protein